MSINRRMDKSDEVFIQWNARETVPHEYFRISGQFVFKLNWHTIPHVFFPRLTVLLTLQGC